MQRERVFTQQSNPSDRHGTTGPQNPNQNTKKKKKTSAAKNSYVNTTKLGYAAGKKNGKRALMDEITAKKK